MSDAVLFIALFGGLFVVRVIAATVVFLWILPDGDRCPAANNGIGTNCLRVCERSNQEG